MGAGQQAPESKPVSFPTPLAQSSAPQRYVLSDLRGFCAVGVLRTCLNCWDSGSPPAPQPSV